MNDMDNNIEYISTKATEEDWQNCIVDEYGVVYSKDGKKVLRVRDCGITECVVHKETEMICDEAFSRCVFLKSIELPDGLLALGEWAFYNCEKLEEIKLPDTITVIKRGAFQDCFHLCSINLPKSLVFLGEDVFYYCWYVESLELPKTLKVITGNPFNASGIFITSKSPLFKVENDVLIQGDKVIALSGTPQKVFVPNYISTIGKEAFLEAYPLSSIKLPEGLTTIEEGAFGEISYLRTVKLPHTLTIIEDDAFCDCSRLTTIVFPDGLTSMGNFVLGHCENLKKIYISCSPNADENAILEKFKGMLEEGLHDKIEIVKRN